MRLLSRFTIWLINILGRIPIGFHYQISRIVSTVFYFCPFLPLCVKVRNNLREAFPSYTKKEIRRIEKRYYQRLLDFGAEFFGRVKDQLNGPQILIENIDVLEKAFSSSSCVTCYSGHFVNYELLIRLPSMVPNLTMYNFYQDSVNDEINTFVENLRSRYGAHLVTNNADGVRKVLEARKTGTKRLLVGSLADVTNNENYKSVNLFGKKIKAFSGTERLGRLMSCQFLYAHITSPKRHQYQIKFIPFEGNGDVTQSFFNLLEENIRQQPELWTLWATIDLNTK